MNEKKVKKKKWRGKSGEERVKKRERREWRGKSGENKLKRRN